MVKDAGGYGSVRQPYGAVGWYGLDGVWVARGTLTRMDAGGGWQVEGGVWLRSEFKYESIG